MSPYITDHDNSSSSGISLDDTPSSTGYGSPRGQEPEDIAVVGMSCRVAGSSDSPEKLWQALLRKEVASGEIPAMRWEPYRRRDTRNAKVRSILHSSYNERRLCPKSRHTPLDHRLCTRLITAETPTDYAARYLTAPHNEVISLKTSKISTTHSLESPTKKQS